MSSPTDVERKSLAFFGATGDCAGFCLAAALKAGYTCTALARTPAKLTKSLLAKGVPSSNLDAHLTIIPGDAKDLESVKKTLTASSNRGAIADIIVSGIGGVPQLQWSLIRPVILNDRTICQDVGNVVLRAAQNIATSSVSASNKKPLFINVSTTGIPSPDSPRDVPLLFVPLYMWLLADPHDDKKALEEDLRAHVALPEDQRGISSFTMVKPSLLMDGEALGLDKVREGWDAQPAIGYTVRREDVGIWMFEKLVKGDRVREQWRNGSATLTY